MAKNNSWINMINSLDKFTDDFMAERNQPKNKKISKKIKGINENLLSQIVDLILKHKKLEKIVIFGSRASDNFKDTSDIDIAVFGKDWTDKDINIVKYNLDEFIKTPLKFDLLNFYKIGKTKLKKNILKEGEIVYEIKKD